MQCVPKREDTLLAPPRPTSVFCLLEVLGIVVMQMLTMRVVDGLVCNVDGLVCTPHIQRRILALIEEKQLEADALHDAGVKQRALLAALTVEYTLQTSTQRRSPMSRAASTIARSGSTDLLRQATSASEPAYFTR